MKLIKRSLLLLIGVLTVLMSGCASINKASPELDAAAKKFQTNSNSSKVYIYRDESLGGAISMPVTVNGKLVGNTGPKSFFLLDLPAGNHTVKSQGDESMVKLKTEKGKLYFIWQEVKMGAFSAGSDLQVVSEQVGKKGVRQCTRIQENP